MSSKRNDGGPAFPFEYELGEGLGRTNHPGMSLRDWFAAHAPEPTADQVNSIYQIDRSRNPYNDPHKPRIRSPLEIIAYLKFQYADAMLAARDAEPKP